MIKKSLLTLFVLLTVWTIVLETTSFKTANGVMPYNRSVIEKYIYENTLDKVIVGSSLGVKLNRRVLSNYYNLSLNGMSAFDGFEIIKREGRCPDIIIAEINMIDRFASYKIINEIYDPFWLPVKRYLKLFRQDRRPLNNLASHVSIKIIKLTRRNIRRIIKRIIPPKKESENNKGTDKKKSIQPIIDRYIIKYNKMETVNSIRRNLPMFFYYVDYFLSKDVKILFIEMPVDNQLIDKLQPTIIRNEIKKRYPDIPIIRAPYDDDYHKTTDAIHLKSSSAKLFSEYLSKELKKLDIN